MLQKSQCFKPEKKRNDLLFAAAFLWIIAFLFVVVILSNCSLFGGGMSPKNKAALDLATKTANEVANEFKNVKGDIVTREEIINIVENTVNYNMQQYMEQNETPFWKIIIPLLICWVVIRLVNAKLDSGSTWKNILRGI